MSRIVSSFALLCCFASLGGIAGATAPCHGPNGKFVKCPPPKTTSAVKVDAKGKCHGANGKFVKCPK